MNNRWITIWLNRPNSRNALSEKMIDELWEVCEAIAKNSSFRGLALRGMDNCFCAGADLKEFKSKFLAEDISRDSIVKTSENTAKLLKRIQTMPQASIALVEGPAFAGGFGLVSCVDFVIATQNSQFSISETKIGLTPAQIAPYVVEKIGKRLTKKLMLSGITFDGNKARKFGLVDEVVKNHHALDRSFLELQDTLKLNGPNATAITKDILLSIDHIEPSQRANFLANKFADCIIGDEAQEGLKAFVEKRIPKWVDA